MTNMEAELQIRTIRLLSLCKEPEKEAAKMLLQVVTTLEREGFSSLSLSYEKALLSDLGVKND